MMCYFYVVVSTIYRGVNHQISVFDTVLDKLESGEGAPWESHPDKLGELHLNDCHKNTQTKAV